MSEPKAKKETVADVTLPESNGAAMITDKEAQKRMAYLYQQEELVEVSISPLYAHEFSKNQPVILNGVRINVPTNGQRYKVPYSFALEINNRIALADEKFKRLNKMADLDSNKESSPGELKLFR